MAALAGKTERLRSFQTLNNALAEEQEAEHLLQVVMRRAADLLEADRSTLFLVDRRRGELWSLIAHGLERDEIRIPMGVGIAGSVASSGEALNIADAYSDPRFHRDVDLRTGYHTRNLLCMALRDPGGEIIGAIQVLNKYTGPFTAEDQHELAALCERAAMLIGAYMKTSDWDRCSP